MSSWLLLRFLLCFRWKVEPAEKIPRWERIQGTHTELMKELFNARVK
jgi:hypothetical protein